MLANIRSVWFICVPTYVIIVDFFSSPFNPFEKKNSDYYVGDKLHKYKPVGHLVCAKYL